MTAVAKLVFGAGYDKARLTEFAGALSWARRGGLEPGSLPRTLENFQGGLKGVVQAERRARRPQARSDGWQAVRDRLLSAPPLARLEMEIDGSEEFVVLVARRDR